MIDFIATLEPGTGMFVVGRGDCVYALFEPGMTGKNMPYRQKIAVMQAME